MIEFKVVFLRYVVHFLLRFSHYFCGLQSFLNHHLTLKLEPWLGVQIGKPRLFVRRLFPSSPDLAKSFRLRGKFRSES